MKSHAVGEQPVPEKTRFRSDKNVTDAKLEITSLSTDVFITVFVWEQAVLRRLVIVLFSNVCLCFAGRENH